MMAERKRRRSKERWLHRISGPLTTFRRNYLQPNKLHHLIHKHFPPGPILDIGCSAGKAIGGVDARFVPFGIEVEVKAAALARERFAARGGRVVEADAIAGLAQFEPSFFTGIVMSSFLEHEANPRAALEGARRVLKTSGGLVVKVPNYACLNRVIRGRRWCGFRFPDHVNYFTPATLTRLLKEEGLEIVRFRFTDRFVTSDTMWLVARKR
jgi:SAM-dependent methyltransferase